MDISVSELSYAAGLSKRRYRILYYFIIVCIHFYMHFWLAEILGHYGFLKRLCFLTNISFYLNTLYYCYVLVMHVPYGHKLKKFKLLQAYFKFSYAISFVVFALYWGMIIANPDLLIPQNGKKWLPLMLDLFLHGANFILNLIEHVYMFPKSDSKAINYVFYLMFVTFYSLFLKFLYIQHDYAVYPFVGKLGIIEFSAVVAAGTGLCFIGDFTYRMLLKKEKLEKKVEKTH